MAVVDAYPRTNLEVSHMLSQHMPLMSHFVYPSCVVSLYVTYCVFAPELAMIRPTNRNFGLYLLLNRIRIHVQFFLAALLVYWTDQSGRNVLYAGVPGPQDIQLDERLDTQKIAWTLWVFHIIKTIRLADCMLIVRGGVDINRFMIYYNAGMVYLSWIAVKYFPGGSSIVPVLINCTIEFQFHLWDEVNKGWPTLHRNTIQKISNTLQVALIFLHSAVGLIQSPCGYPELLFLAVVLYILSYFVVALICYDGSLSQVMWSFCFYYDQDEPPLPRNNVIRHRPLEIVVRRRRLTDFGAAGDCHPLGVRRRFEL